ncbi:MAG: SEC-C domain-containing protein [Deltaproteobacteria bacterium]|nr:SEC-C domain-containing protein [Deltaproteobacteria bacterium]
MTEHGVRTVEGLLNVENLYDPAAMPLLHAVSQALIAHTLKKLDVDYVVKPGEDGGKEVMIVDEFTGRLMPGRRWSDGLHQAVEAKEGIKVQGENQTLASITFQNYFRMYDTLSGMTGTADTEAQEFAATYNLNVVVVPTNRPINRSDFADAIYKSRGEKFNAVIDDVRDCHERGQPVLVGTISIETSEMLSRKLSKFGVKHNVLNAKQHEKEAEIVAQAGRKGGVTIATNMAGRGTDIVLGGNAEALALEKCGRNLEHPDYEATLAEYQEKCEKARDEVVAAGGLHIIGTERHESRRIDNQLRGRSGRQGDPGSTRFYLSLEDDLMRIFGSERIVPWMERLGLEEGEAIEHRMITRAIEGAQQKVEARNFDSRKHVLEYDDVMNKQRQAFYGQRRFVQGLEGEDLHAELLEMIEGVLVDILDMHWPAKGVPEGEVADEISKAIAAEFGVQVAVDSEFFEEDKVSDRNAFGRNVYEHLEKTLDEKRVHCAEYEEKYAEINYPPFDRFERDILMSTLDRLWKDHLLTMDGLKEAIGLRGYGQRDPKMEYKREGFGLFEDMNRRIDHQVSEMLLKFTLPEPVAAQPQARQAPAARPRQGNLFGSSAKPGKPPQKVGRNEPCPCGSGKKFKKCHGAA